MRFVITLEDDDVTRLKATCERYGVQNPANMVRELVAAGLTRDEAIWKKHEQQQDDLKAAFRQRVSLAERVREAWRSLRPARF